MILDEIVIMGMELSIPLLGAIISMVAASIAVLLGLTDTVPKRLKVEWDRNVDEYQADVQASFVMENENVSFVIKLALIMASSAIAVSIFFLHGVTKESFVYSFFFVSLILLVGINLKHQILPDVIVMPVLWSGLLFHALLGVAPVNYIYGAVLGYLIPFTLFLMVKIKTGKEIIGFGDLKMFALLGAWFGVAMLPTVFAVFIAVLVASVILTLVMRREGVLPTGLFYAAAALVAYFNGSVFTQLG